LAEFLGKTIIQHVYERAEQSEVLADLIVATDDERILETVTDFGGNAVMTSSDHQSGTDRIAEVARKIDADIVVNIQGDEPLIEPKAIDAAVEPLLEDETIAMSTLASEISNDNELANPNVVKVVLDNDNFALYFSRSPIPFARDGLDLRNQVYYKHIGLYVYRTNFLINFSEMAQSYLEKLEKLEQLRALENGYRIKVIKTQYKSIGVDTPDDLEMLEKLVNIKNH
jgi:3-deoxy-manno-octulosonate cytidylyltransferase (CMP-KDO synthetase)